MIKKNIEHIRVSKGIKEELKLENQEEGKDADSWDDRKVSVLKDSGDGEKDSDDEEVFKENERKLMESVRKTVEAEEENKD